MPTLLRRALLAVDRTDRELVLRDGQMPPSKLDDLLKRLTATADHSMLWLTVAAVLATRKGANRSAALRGLVSIAGSSFAANALAKPLLPRRRPAADALPRRRTLGRPPTSSSFPSGHAASAAAFTTAVAMESPRTAAVIAPVAAAVAYSRVHVGVHWPSDVLAGAALGGGVALATRRWWPLRPNRPADARTAGHAEALPDGEGLAVVANPRSGPSDTDPDRLLADDLPAAAVLALGTGDDLMELLTKAATGTGTRALGVAGGDGSVAAAAAVAAERDLPLVVLPTGTLNHFARDLGVPDVAAAAQAVREGSAVRIGLASVTVHGPGGRTVRPFLNTASLGGYPDLVRLREKWQDRWGKWPAAAAALIRVLASAAPMRLVVDGKPVTAWIMFVGNNVYQPRGMTPAYRPDLNSGLLDLRYLRADVPLSRTRFAFGALAGVLQHTRVYVQREVRAVDVVVRGEPVSLATDGEADLAGRRFRFAAVERHLTVYR